MTTIASGVTAKLTTKMLPYNCGTKFLGRLALEINGHSDVGALAKYQKEIASHKEDIIKEFVTTGLPKINMPLNMGMSNHPIWPSDGGIYPHGMMLYADALNKGGYWYSDWTMLIREFVAHPKTYGVKVLRLAHYVNKLYNSKSKISCLWAIFLPSTVDCLLTPDNDKFMFKGLKRTDLGNYPKEDQDIILSLVS